MNMEAALKDIDDAQIEIARLEQELAKDLWEKETESFQEHLNSTC